MKFTGLESPDLEVEAQAAMQNTEVLNPGCECNYVRLEMTLSCRVSIPGSQGQRAYSLAYLVYVQIGVPYVRVPVFQAAGTGIFNICPGKGRSGAWRNSPTAGTGPRHLIFFPLCRMRAALWPGCATSYQGHCSRGTRCQGQGARGCSRSLCAPAGVVGRIQPLSCCCARSHGGQGGGSCLAWMHGARGCFLSVIQLWHLLLPQ